MVREKTQVKRIENAISRQVTFCKRRNGLLKKAYELSELCNAEVGLVIFSPRGELDEFATTSMQKMLQKYDAHLQACNRNTTIQKDDIQGLKRELADNAARIMTLEATKRKMLGEGLASCSLTELNQLEGKAERVLRQIRARKTQILVDKIEQVQGEVARLSDENAFISQKVKSNLNLNVARLSDENAFIRQKNVDPGCMFGSMLAVPSTGFGTIEHT